MALNHTVLKIRGSRVTNLYICPLDLHMDPTAYLCLHVGSAGFKHLSTGQSTQDSMKLCHDIMPHNCTQALCIGHFQANLLWLSILQLNHTEKVDKRDEVRLGETHDSVISLT